MSTTGKKESDSSELDRLSILDEGILQHILSFLDTRSAVQTCVLSTKWRELWTAVPALNFNISPFSSSLNFVENVLGKRNRNSPVRTCFFDFEGGYDENLLGRVINNVNPHVNHFSITISPCDYGPWNPFPIRLLECQDLETLRLKGFEFTEPLNYTELTSLRLENCNFLENSGSFDVLSSCPSVKNLCLSSCRCDAKLKVLKISGPHLLSLTIDDLGVSDLFSMSPSMDDVRELEISASEVTFFRCTELHGVYFSVIKLPSLKHADLDHGQPLPSGFLECQNLETLRLKCCTLTEPLRYTKLEYLRMEWCGFRGNSFDVLSCCPSLKNLCLSACGCGSLKVLKISGPHLLSLTIDNLTCQCEVEISAPEVTFFRCTGLYGVDFSVINLPSLKHADLDLGIAWSKPIHGPDKQKYYNSVKLFEGISYVQYLTLSSSTIKALDLVPVLEHLPTPFSRLKQWNLKQEEPNNRSCLMPAKVSRFLGWPRLEPFHIS